MNIITECTNHEVMYCENPQCPNKKPLLFFPRHYAMRKGRHTIIIYSYKCSVCFNYAKNLYRCPYHDKIDFCHYCINRSRQISQIQMPTIFRMKLKTGQFSV